MQIMIHVSYLDYLHKLKLHLSTSIVYEFVMILYMIFLGFEI